MNDILEELLEAWRTNNRINLFLIDTIEAAGMQATLSTRGGRTVARQFAHMHNNRIYHLEGRARDLSKGLRKFETAEKPGPEQLADAFRLSSERFEAFIERGVTGTGRCRTFKKGIVSNVTYMVAHEGHHRGSILLTLKQSGHAPTQADRYKIWNWDKI